MKYTITGASGNTGKIIADRLLAAGHEVIAIGRSAQNLQQLEEKGAALAIGDLEDEAFLVKSFTGADAVYGMVPPKMDLTEPWRAFIRRTATNITNALEITGVKHAVILSSSGSQLVPFGAGPVSGLGEWEFQLQNVRGLNVLALKPAYFLQNLYVFIPMIKHAGMIGSPFPPDFSTPMVHTNDIAEAAAKRLLDLTFSGFTKEFIISEREYSMPQVARVLGTAVGNPDLKSVQLSFDDQRTGMLQVGMPEPLVDGYMELNHGILSGKWFSDYSGKPEHLAPTTLEDFSGEFAAAFKHN